MEKINVFILYYLNSIHKHSTLLFCCMEVTIQHIFGNNRYFLYYLNIHTSANLVVTEEYVIAIPKK